MLQWLLIDFFLILTSFYFIIIFVSIIMTMTNFCKLLNKNTITISNIIYLLKMKCLNYCINNKILKLTFFFKIKSNVYEIDICLK